MPSTKRRPTKRPACFELPEQRQDLMEECKRRVKRKILLLEQRAKTALNVLDNAHQSLLATYSEADLQKTIGQIREENRLREESKKNILSKTASAYKTRRSKDEGYITETTSGSSSSSITPGTSLTGISMLPVPKSIKKPARRLSRSLSRSTTKNMTSTMSSSGVSSMGPPSSVIRGRPRRSSSTSAVHKSVFKTPAPYMANTLPPITPKIDFNTPMTRMRRAKKGETVLLSMSGSPVLPGSAIEDVPSCNIPLEDGTFLSLVPKKIRQSQFQLPVEYMAPDTYRQLALLKNNLAIVCDIIERRNLASS